MSLLDTEQLQWLQNELLDRKRSIEQRLEHNDHYGLEHTHRYETGELSTIDNHPGDVGTEVYERAKDVSLTEHDEFMLERIDSALHAMKEGSYGSCAACGAAIPYERLQAIPYTIYCVQHSRETQASNNRPVEEEFLSPPFGRSSLDEHEYSGFDGEDAWQIVESWGSSNSPAMAESNEITHYDDIEIEAGDDLGGFVESYENFVATDLYGHDVTVIRSKQYQDYLDKGEGVPLLETEHEDEE